MDVSKGDTSPGFNAVFTNMGLQGMSEGKYYCLHMCYCVWFRFIDRATRFSEEAPIKNVHTINLDSLGYFREYRSDGESNSRHSRDWGESTMHLEEVMKSTFDRHCETWLYTLKFHLLCHMVEDLDGGLEARSPARIAV